MDSRTTVYPFRFVGHTVSAPAAGGGLVAGGGVVGVSGGPVVVGVPLGTVGRATVAVSGGVTGWRGVPACVATSVLLLPRESVATTATAPPITATTSPSSTGQTHSPGYQPNRRRHASESRPTTPPPAPSRWPHSRQYSWPAR